MCKKRPYTTLMDSTTKISSEDQLINAFGPYKSPVSLKSWYARSAKKQVQSRASSAHLH